MKNKLLIIALLMIHWNPVRAQYPLQPDSFVVVVSRSFSLGSGDSLRRVSDMFEKEVQHTLRDFYPARITIDGIKVTLTNSDQEHLKVTFRAVLIQSDSLHAFLSFRHIGSCAISEDRVDAIYDAKYKMDCKWEEVMCRLDSTHDDDLRWYTFMRTVKTLDGFYFSLCESFIASRIR